MFLQKLTLDNIRSYEKETIHFRDGVTLFEGDIGSGKSSILNAVEFALFGLGDQSGAHLLRLGEPEGSVELEIIVHNQIYTLGRSLKRRGKTVYQSECYIVEKGVQTRYNVTDMKKRVLQILDFKEPSNPRSQSVIYRYAVFTPQEQMREVIRQKIEDRKETLRKAFGVEEYSIAADNTGTLLTEIRSETRALNVSLEEIPRIKQRIDNEKQAQKAQEDKIEQAETTLQALLEEFSDLESQITEKKKQKKTLEEHQTYHKLREQEKNQTENQIKKLNQAKEELQRSNEKARKSMETMKQLEPKYQELTTLREKLPRYEEKHKISINAEQSIKLLQSEIQGLKTTIESQIKSGKKQLKGLESEQNNAEQAKETQEELEPKYSELLVLKKQLPELEKAENKHRDSSNQIQILETKYASAKENLEKQVKDEKQNLREMEKDAEKTQIKLDKIPGLKQEKKTLEEQTANKPEYEETQQELEKEKTHIELQNSSLEKQKKEKTKEWEDIEQIGVGAQCPRCHQRLTQKHYEQLKIEYRNEIKQIAAEKEKNKAELNKIKDELSENSKKLNAIHVIEVRISKVSQEITSLNTIKETYSENIQRVKKKKEYLEELEKNLQEEVFAVKINEELQIHREIIQSLDELVRKYNQVKSKIEEQEKNQVEAKYITAKTQAEKLPLITSQIEAKVKQIEELEKNIITEDYAKEKQAEIQKHRQTIKELKKEVEAYYITREKISTLEENQIESKYTQAKTEAARIPEIQANITETVETIQSLEANVKQVEEEISELGQKISALKKVPEELEVLESKKATVEKNRATQRQIIKSSKEVIEGIVERIASLNKDLARHQNNLEQANVLRIIEAWITQVLLPSIQSIEKNVLYTINQEFNRLFKRWFSTLIESEELQGIIDEDFTPIVEQGGYELDVESLSGGEKTSAALAYRLALNTIVKQVTNTMRSNLLILDEPTDGFSKEQLNKLRDILNELGCNQVILVSHEKELETVADAIYHVHKTGNTSTVQHP